ncbi:NAD(P)-binding domain-containing protein [Alkalihalophilus pseudofirmus]|uniref:NAD(P)-binding domain-containing protein n=1 Tax=Alkalihalophilus pseudofirmus TaxID=79885 RepID=A0AAJ2U2X4_ALKPS|nr:NAD(P)-binding domain-containing protein [Alkalihalophilus pseudofirmus]MDV2887384.1 NAD(P)-binding domain-containing protein [Alkalihalophilus pseudofirmus]WEG16951.1 NAD(P)-binding domain-containing protein [Alkalihalophilus pseudofirmus]
MNIGFIGFGEVGFEMSKGFYSQGKNLNLFVYDHLYKNIETKYRAEKVQAALFDEPLKVVQQELNILFVAVPASYSSEAWNSILPGLNKNTLCVDLSTASSETKQRICKELSNKDITFIDAAIMGPLKGNQHKVPMIVSGIGAKEFIKWGKTFEMNLSYVSELAGDATNIKFIRSIFTKGLSTLLFEVMEIADKLNLDDTILDSITKTIDKEPFENVINRLITGNVLHSERRIKEMDNVIDFMLNNHVEAEMTKATRNKLITITNSSIKEKFHGKAPLHWKEVMQKINET